MTIFAAGCVVYRQTEAGVELLLAHRPRYDDWTFPKGKRDKGETDIDCAKREVQEETGFSGDLGVELTPTRYVVKPKKSRSNEQLEEKVVRWWLMEAATGSFVPNDEVDAVRWVTPAEAGLLLTYDHDRDLLAEPAVVELVGK